MDALEKGKSVFSGKADFYARNRPSYPRELIRWLKSRADLDAVADVGAGTGIFTACLVPECGSLIAVEPNDDMRAALQARLPQVRCLAGSAEETGLPDSSLSLVTAAQAFHWFDEARFRRECCRILRRGGKLAVIWNNWRDCGIRSASEAVFRKFCPEFHSAHAGKRTVEEGDRFLRESYFREVELFRCLNPVRSGEEQFVGEKLSRSYAPAAGTPEYRDFIAAQRLVFREFARGGEVTEEYESVVYLGRL